MKVIELELLISHLIIYQSHRANERDESMDSESEDSIPRKTQGENQRYFTGMGYTLGDDHTETKMISKDTNAGYLNGSSSGNSQTVRKRHLKEIFVMSLSFDL